MTDGTTKRRTIPFTRAQRSAIRTTGLLMLPAALLSLYSGVTALQEVLPVVMVVQAWPILVMTLGAVAEAVLGLGLLVGGIVFLRIAGEASVAAMARGLRALLVVFVIKAAVLLLALAAMLFVWLGLSLPGL